MSTRHNANIVTEGDQRMIHYQAFTIQVSEDIAVNTPRMPEVLIVADKPMTSSLAVAQYFGKRHDNVIRTIETLECSLEFRLLNFEESYYRNQQQKRQRCYLITKDGFVFLAMGFTGKKAARFKENYIRQFNQMAAWVTERCEARTEQKELADAMKRYIDRTGEDAHGHAYCNEARLLNRLVLGMNPVKWARERGIESRQVRDHMSERQLSLLTYLESRDAALLDMDLPYEERKTRLTVLIERHQEVCHVR